MTRIIHAELLRLVRRRTVVITATACMAFAAIATLAVFASPRSDGGPASRRGGTTLAALADAGGGTESFAIGASFVGFLVFVTFIALTATDFSSGTFRALLLRDPHRLRVIVGKLAGGLLVAAAALALAEVLSFGLSLVVAPGKDIDTGAWFSLDGLAAAVGDYATALAGVTGWAIFGTTLAVIFRSAPIALGVGFAWAGPFENIVVDSWSAGYRYFPGQVLGSLIQGGSTELGLGRAITTGVLYAGVAAVAGALILTRRDVTS